MADSYDIIISAVDSASEAFQSIINTVTEFGSSVSDTVTNAGSDFDGLAENVSGFQDAVDNIDDSTIEALAEELGLSTEEVERLIEAGANLGSIPFDEASASADELEKEIDEAADAMERLDSAGDVKAAETFQQMCEMTADTMWNMADRAGTVGDSITRMGLAAQGAGIDIDTMKNAVSEMADETGRSAGSIREAFISMTSAGITDMEAMKSLFEGASAQAFILGTDVNALAEKFSGLAMKSSLSERSLKGTGITMEELGEAMGMQGASIDEIKQKWAELDVNQRAAALGMASSMNEGANANEAYKNSWEGLKNQVEIAKGKLMTMAGQVLLPVLIPAMQLAGTVLQGVGDVISWVMSSPLGGLVSILGAAAGAFLIVVTGVSALSTMMSILGLESTFTTIETIALALAEDGLSVSSLLAAASQVGLTGGLMATAAAGWAAATAIWAALAPLLPFIAAAVAVAVAIYEIGKALGWWTDFSSMLDAIWAGLQRIWDAFINHPDVQAVLQAISDAWNWIVEAVSNAWNAIMGFLGIFGGGEFDIVHAIIEAIGWAWQTLTFPIRMVITIIMKLVEVFQWLWNATAPVRDMLTNALMPAFVAIGQAIWTVISAVWNIISAFGDLLNGSIDLGEFLTTVFTESWNVISAIFMELVPTIAEALMNVMMAIMQWAADLLVQGVQAGWNFIVGVATWFAQLPGRIWSFLVGVATNIATSTAQWVSTGIQKASQFVTGIINYIRQLPGKVLTWMMSTLTNIINSAKQWVTNVKNKAKELVDGAVNKIKELPGKIASAIAGVVDAIVKPFKDAYNQAKYWWDQITSLGGTLGGADTYGGYDLAYGGEESDDEKRYNLIKKIIAETPNNRDSFEIHHSFDDQQLILDLKNVPAHIDEETLCTMLESKKVLQRMIQNQDFQNIDAKTKRELHARVNRARGI